MIFKQLSWLAVSAFLLASCKRDESVPNVVLTGKVRLVTEFGTPASTGNGVTIDNIEVKGATAATATNGNGQYELKTITGSQTLTFTKQYVGTYKLLNYPATGSSEVPLVTLGAQPTYTIASALVKMGPDAVYVSGIVGRDNIAGLPPRRHRIFFQSGPVSSTDYSLSVGGETNVGDDQYFDVVTFAQLRAAGLLPGTPIQIRVYAENPYADTYVDPDTRRTVYPALSQIGSNTAHFTY
ncbi:hypothetical protein [Hymenobacter sp. 102]|uniref:hypothetical protein n=1 Tax=Hymenobacter sp. 102 TaxID=3403152 RepID=UPI003CE8825E